MILRRIYLYLVSAAALGVLAAGLSLLGFTTLLFVFNDPSAQDSRGSLAAYTAMTLVALPVWGIHFWFARRFALRDSAERASAIRRLYVYAACLAMSVGATVALAFALDDVLRPLLANCPAGGSVGCPAAFSWLSTTQAAWVALVLGVMWAFHFRTAARDRAAVGEEGASATLRRWYMYPVLLIGLLMALSGASTLIQVGWLKASNSQLATDRYLGDPAALLLAGLALWAFHARDISRGHMDTDRHSTLRALEGFIAVGVSIVIALLGASQILFYVLARLLGVSNPGGIGNDVIAGLAGPGSQLLVYGTAWVLVRRRLDRDARVQEADRQAGIRRLYTNLAALLSLAAWAVGAGGLLWTLAEQLEAPIIGVTAGDWRNPVSLFTTLLLVGAVVWLAHWQHAPWAVDRQSLPRRLYVWAALLVSVLTVLGGAVGMLTALLRQLFSASPKLNDTSNLDFGHYLAVIVVAAIVGLYHWRVLRADAAARPPKRAVATAPDAAPAPAAPHSQRYVLSVTDATEDDLRRALANLPADATYKLTPSEQAR